MPGFRLSAKYIFLTFPQSAGIPHDVLHGRLVSTANVHTVYSCREDHDDEHAGEHHHALIRGENKFNIRNERHFDIEYNGVTYHPSIEAVRNLEASNVYIGKDGRTLGLPIIGTKASKKNDYARILQESQDAASFMANVREADPVGYVHNLQRLEYFADTTFRKPVSYGSSYDRESFGNVPVACDRWVNEELFNGRERPKALVIIGEPGWGKTKWAQSLGVPFNYWMRYITGRRTMGARYAILDDFDEIKRSEFKGFWGSQEVIGVKVSNGVSGHKQWEWGIPSIWLFNECPEYLNDVNSYEYKRSIVVTLQGPMF